MSIAIVFNGTTFNIPSPSESADWASALNAFFQALATAKPTTALAGTGTAGTANSGVTGLGGSAGGKGGAFTGVGDGAGVLGSGGATGYGVIAAAAGVVRSAFRLVPQASEPTGPNAVGDLYSTLAGVVKVCTVAGSPGTWQSVGAQT